MVPDAESPVTASARTRYACLLALGILLIPLQSVRIGVEPDDETGRLMVTTNHPGMEASGVERLITIPIEDALSSVTGLRSIRSLSAPGRSTIELDFLDRVDAVAAYLEVRQWLDIVHSKLPHASHRPLVARGSMESRPVFTVAFPAESWNEREIRRRFERIDGVARVDVSGLPRAEVVITTGRSRDAQPFTNVAVESFRAAHSVASIHRAARSSVVIDGRLRSPSKVEAVRLASGLSIGDHVQVQRDASPLASRATVDRRPLAFVAVHRQGDTALVALSRRLRAEAGGIEGALVLTDRGDTVERAVHGVLWSIAAGIAAVGVVIATVRRSMVETLFCIASIAAAAVCGMSAAGLAGIELTADSLAAIAVSAGFAADLALFFLDARRTAHCSTRARTDIAPTIVCAIATTLVVFAPLLWWPDAASAGLTGIAIVISGSLTGAALFVLGAAPAVPDMASSPSSQTHTWVIAVTRWASRRHRRVIAAAAVISLAGGIAAWQIHRFGVPDAPESSVSIVAEFPGGTTPDAVSAAVEPLRAAVERVPGIQTTIVVIESERARIELFLAGGKNTGSVQNLVRSVSASIPTATIWFPHDAAADVRRSVPILVRATSTQEAQQIAREIASLIGGHPSTEAVLFRFKEGAAACVLQTDLDGLVQTGSQLRDVVEPIRRAHSRPVIAKWHEGEQELDVVLAMGQLPAGDCLTDARWLSETVPPGTGDTLSASWEPALGRISRHDRAPSAELVVLTSRPAEIRSAAVTQAIALPAFATVHVDPSEPLRRRQRRTTTVASALALVLVGFVLLIRYQRLRAVITALALVPPTLAVPLVVAAMIRAPLDRSLLAGLLLAAGSGVNNAILVLDRVQVHGEQTLEAIRRSLTPIVLATITTVTAVIPLVGLGATAGAAAMISMVVAVGTVAALAATALLLPAVMDGFRPPLSSNQRSRPTRRSIRSAAIGDTDTAAETR
ncbi:MAG: efflux RND transporter permease subunit [Spirochaetaceae bacterium]|nr:MAG: efflux RND transporter permease subunit [Spirochaetaceae bacterium]